MAGDDATRDAREETFEALRALAGLADRADAEGWTKLGAALRTTAEAVESRLRTSDVTIVIAGGRAKRTLLDALAGATLFGADTKESLSTFVEMRRAKRSDFVARLHDGRVEDLSRKIADRGPAYAQEIARAEKELEAATFRSATLDIELAAKEETLSERRLIAAEKERPVPGVGTRLRALYALIAAWILATLRIRARPVLPAAPARRSPGGARVVSAMIARRDVERMMETAERDLEKRRADLDRLRKEAAQHEQDRKAAFVAEVRTLTDAAQRADEVFELALRVDGGLLPEGIVIIDAPAVVAPDRPRVDEEVRRAQLRDLRDRAAACILLASPPSASVAIADLEDALRPIVPYVIDATDETTFAAGLVEALPPLFERARADAALSVVALALADMPSRMQALANAVAAGETEQRARIETLERDRLPEPGKFREEQLARMAGSIDEGARRVLKRARIRLRERVVELEREWVSAVDACNDRRSLGACVARIEHAAAERVQALLDGVGDDIGAEMQATSELLQVWVLEEVRQKYKTRYLHADKAALVVAELPAETIGALARPALTRVLASFDRKRFGVAAGALASGGAAGAVLYGAAHTATGAAIGAASGVVAALYAVFVPRSALLKERCIAALRTHVAEIETSVAAWLEGSCDTFARDIRAAIDDTLEDALNRRDQSIVRLIDLEGKALEREQARLRELTALRDALGEHAARFASRADRSAAALREHVARTR